MRPGDGVIVSFSFSFSFKLRPGVYYFPKEQGMGYAPWENNIHRAFIFDENETMTPSPSLKGTAS